MPTEAKAEVLTIEGVQFLKTKVNFTCKACKYWYEQAPKGGINADLKAPKQGACKKNPPLMFPLYVVNAQNPAGPPALIIAGYSTSPLVTLADDFCHSFRARDEI